jgi:hypothetical protein
MPLSAHEAYFALRVFNVKIASIKDLLRLVAIRAAACGGQSCFEDNNALGGNLSSLATRLQMQWWRDAILGMYKGRSTMADDGNGRHLASLARQNPMLRSLADATQTHGLKN